MTPEAPATRQAMWWRRLGWLVLIWSTSVLTLGLVGGVVGLALR